MTLSKELLWRSIQQPEREKKKYYTKFLKTIRDICNPFLLPTNTFIQFFRLPPHLVLCLVDKLEMFLNADHRLQNTLRHIPNHLKVLTTLTFFAFGSYQKAVGSHFAHPCAQPTVCRVLKLTINGLLQISKDYIVFPKSSARRQSSSRQFQVLMGLPGVIGVVDGSLIPIVKPKTAEGAYYSRKHTHAINVQIVSDHKFRIIAFKCMPGSYTDKTIWELSNIKKYMENLRLANRYERPYYFIGDSGYDPSPILLVPEVDAIPNSPASKFTAHLTRTRVLVEQSLGKLKNVWRCLHKERKLYYDPDKASKIIAACIVVHNFGINNGQRFADADVLDPIEQLNLEAEFDASIEHGRDERDRILRKYFL